MKSVNKERLITAAAAAALFVAPHAAHAQAAFLSGVTNWLQGTAMTGLATLAVIVLGIILMMMRFSLVHAVCICCGIWIAFNAAYLAGLLRT